MRKIIRANNTVAVAIGAAIGSVDNGDAHNSFDHKADVDANPLVPTPTDAGHLDLPFNLEATSGAVDLSTDAGHPAIAAITDDGLRSDTGSIHDGDAFPSLLTLLSGDSPSHDMSSHASWAGIETASDGDDVFSIAAHDFGAPSFHGSSDAHALDTSSSASFAPNANNNLAAACAGPLGSGEPDHSNPINDSAASAPIFTGGCCATCANVADCMRGGDGDGDGDDGFILITGGNSAAGGAGAGTGVGGDASLVGGGSASAGLVINVVYDASVANAPAAFKADVSAAVQYFESHFNNPITITIDVGYGEVDGMAMSGGALGQSFYYVMPYTYDQVRNALISHAQSANDMSAVASLPVSDPTNGGTFYVSTAEVKALGLASGISTDGFVGLSAGGVFDYDSSDGISAGQFDFTGTVMHEISEVLGREMMDGSGGVYYPMDLFHYSASGVRTFSGSTPGYLSVDNGQTNLVNLNTNPAGDMGDWAGNTVDAGNAYGSTGVVAPFSAADLTVMDMIGWNLATGGPTVTASLAADTGISSGDKITSNATITGTGNANAVVTITEGATTLGTATANASGVWTFTPVGLANGAHTLTASETDSSGNTGTVSLTFTLDTTAPVAPSIASFSTDSGVVGDGITNDNTLTLTGTAEANSTVKVFDGATLLGSATASGTGAWTYTTVALANGAHSLTATATDAAGNTGVASAALGVTIDTTAPVAPSIASFSTDSGVVGDGITNVNVLTLTGTAEANSTVKVFDGATLLGTANANGAGAWSYTTVALANGAHSLTATATDAAGNTGVASAALGVTIDTTAPVAPSIASFSTDSGTVGDGITSDSTLTLTGTAEANSTVKVFDGATLLGTATANGTGTWTYTTVALANGAHSLTATATDAAGNTGVASAALGVTIDTTAPVAPSIASFSTDSGVVGDGITNDNTLTLTGTAEANSTVKVFDGATLLGSVSADGTGAWTYTTAALTNGAHSLTATATDAAGNTGVASAALGVTIDTTAPVAPSIASFSTDSGVVGDGITNVNVLTLTGTAEANATVKVFDGATLLGSAIASGTGTWSYTTVALANGAHSLTATATDAAGNTGVASAALSVTVDTTAPVAPSITSFSTDSGVVGDSITNDNTLTLTGTAEANATVKVFDGATLLGTATANGTGAWSYTTVALANGAHSLTATATDAAGNTGVASAALAVTIDTHVPTTPSITSFSPDTGTVGDGITNANVLTLTGTAEANATVKVFDGATLLGSATANGTGAWSFTTGTLSNTTHNLTATATDTAGTTSAASAALNVTVNNAAPAAPAITSFSTDSGVVGDGITSDNTLTLTGTAVANSTVKVFDGATLLGSVSADGAGAWTYTTAVLNNGAHSLTATATDSAGNNSASSATLSVTVDTTAPIAPSITSFSTDSGVAGDGLTNDNTLTLTGTAEANATVKVFDGATLLGSAIASGTGAWSYTTAALANGAHSLTATATDAAGNTGVASAALGVTIDTTAPVAPSIASFSTDSGTVGDGITNDNTLTLTGTAEANATVKVFDGATLLGSVSADGTGAWTYTTVALTNGAHSLTATATDAAGNTGVASAALGVTIDTTAPVAPSIASFSTDSGTVGDGITNVNVLTLTGTAEANATVKVFDGATLLGTATANGTGAWTYTTAALTNGAHSLTATATDAAGNTGVASAALGVTIDTTAPVAPSIASFSTDSGVVGDGITNDNTLTLTGTAEANSTVKVFDGATLLGSATASGTGAWTYTTVALANGAHSLTATATDAAGNTGVASAALGVTIDTTAPVAPSIASFSTDSGVVGDGITNVNVLTLTGTAEANSTVKVFDGATLLGTANANGAGAWSYTTVALANGAHSLTATATDAAGNTGVASAALGVTIDTTAPVAPSIASFSTDSGTVGDGITSDSTLTLTGTAEANSTVKVFDGATLLGTATANGTGTWTYTTVALANGAHSLTATATDAAGNTGVASAALGVTIDTTAPVAPSIASFSTDSGVVGDGITNDNTLTLTGTAEANSTVKVFDGATLLGSVSADGTGAWTYTTAALTNGAHSLTATATDAAGNTGVASAALGVTIDTTAPVAPSIASFSTDSGVVGDGITNVNVLTLTGTAEANATVKVFDGATLLGSAIASGTGTWSYTTVALANGAHSLTATATDAAGNTGVASAALSVTVDTTAPVAPSITSFSTDSGVVGDSITNDNTLTLTGTAEANATVKVFDGATLLGTATANGTGAWSYTTVALANGAHSLTATATDAAGNTGVASAALAVTIDTHVPTTPSITSFSPDTGTVGDGITNANVLTLTGTAEANATVKVFDGATLLGSATANGTGAWSFTTGTLSNTTHNLTATATDTAGTTSAASAALNVTVNNAAPAAPAITSFSTDSGVVGDGITSDNTLTLTGTAVANSTVKVFDGATLLGSVSADGAGAWTYTTAVLNNGAHSLTATATDSAGNNSASSATLSVTVDTTAPIAPSITSFSTDSGVAGDGLTNDNTLTLTGTAEANATVKVFDGATLLGSAIASGTGAWSYTTAALANGAHSLTATATDAAGNTGVASAALGVTIDTTAPVAPSIASFSTDSGTVGDGITNDNTLTLTGTAEANATVKVFDGATLLGSVSADGTGAWTYTTVALTNGAHSLTATATDAAGNTGVASAALGVTIDTTAPVAPSIASFSTDSGTVGDGITNVNVLTLTGTAEANATVKVFDGATLLGTATANGTGAWTYTTAALTNGAHSLTATATDAAGNTGVASAALGVTIDTTAPVAPSIASFSTDSGVVGDGITNDNTLTLTGTAEANSTVKVFDGATLLGSATASGTGAWTYTTVALANGAHSLTATATDAAGNTGVASAALGVTIDTTAPVAPSIASFSTDSGVVGDGITNVNVLTLTGTAEANSTVKVFDGATLLGTANANGAGAWSYTTVALANGAHSLTATATDAAGNTGVASAALGVTIDTTAPVAPSIASFSTDSGTVGDGITSDSTLTLTGTAEANSTVKVFDGATLLGTATANGTGTWTYTTVALANGAHSLTATATDAAGNTGVASAALGVTIDTTAPVAPSIASNAIVNFNDVALTGTAEANGAVKIYDGATLLGSTTADNNGNWAYTTAALTNGTHNLTATATDAAGNTGAASAATPVTINIPTPTTPTITSFSVDTGTVGDNITDAKTLTLTGTADAGTTIKIYDGTTLLGTTTADGSGAWNFLTATLADGAHSFSATAGITTGGNSLLATSATSGALVVTIDTAAPIVPTITSFSTDSGAVGDHITNDNTPTLAGTAEANSTVKVFDGATLLGSAIANGAGAWTYTTAALADGAHSLAASATDVAGNISATGAALNLTIDTAAPLTPVLTGQYNMRGFVYLVGSADANSTVSIYDANSNTLLGTTTATASGFWSYYKLGTNSSAYVITATDAAGNTSVQPHQTPGVPTIESFTPDTGVAGDHVTNAGVMTLAGKATAGGTVSIYDGAALVGTAIAAAGGTWSFATSALADGNHSFTVTNTIAGTTSAVSAALSITVDTVAPVAPSITSFSTDSGVVGDGITNDNTLTLTGTAEANATVKVFDGATLLGTATASGTGAWTYTTAALNNGAHSLTATATDIAGNTGAASGALAVTIDTTTPVAPSIASFSTDSGVVGDGITNDNTLTLTGTAEANATVKVFDGATLLGSAVASGTGAWTYTTVALANGAHSLTATATDAAGNTGAASGALGVTIDTTAPVAPSIASFSTDSSTVGDGITNDSTLTLTGTAEANATVKVFDGATLLGSAIASGTGAWTYTTVALANGAHSLTATATDAAGNTGVASAALGVTVDTVAPTAPSITSDLIVNMNEVALTGAAEAGSTVKIYDGATLLGSTTANSGGAWSFTTGALSNATHNLAATATDLAGNTGATSTIAAVTVNVPVASTPTIMSFSNDSGTVGDDITNDKTLTLTGTADASATVKIFDGATLLGSTTADSSGGWSFLTGALSDGVHSFAATAGLVNGGTSLAMSSESGALVVTIDATAPVAPTIVSFSTDSGAVGDHVTNDNTPTLTGTAEANSVIHVYDGATLLGSTVTNGSGAWTFDTTTSLADGNHSLSTTATDAAGNTGSASTALSLTIDTAAPTAPSITTDAVVNMNHVALTGAAEANSTVKVFDGATLLGSTTVDGTGAWSYVTGALNNGAHSLTTVDTDVAGNVGSSSADVDVNIDASIAVSSTGYSAYARGLGVLYGTSEANSSISVYDGNSGAAIGHAVANSAGAWSALMGGITNSTVHNFVMTATDAAGHVGSTQALIGTSGNDIIANNAANEVLMGNGGADTFVFSGSIGKATVADFQASTDVVQLNHNAFASYADVLAHAAQVGSDVTIAIGATDSVTLHNTALTQLTSNNFHLV